METGTLSHKRTLKNLQERYDAGILEPNALDSNGLSLVHQFAYDGQVTCLKWLLKHGGSVTARSSEGCVAAHYAAAGGHLPILHLLKEEQKDCTDIKDNNYTYPLYIAAQEGQLDVVMWLTKHSRVSGSEPAKDGMTAVHAAAQEGHLDCVRYLIQLAHCSPVQADYSGCTPLHFASAEGHWKVVKWLLTYGGAEADLRDKTGSAAIHLAAEYNNIKVLKLLAKLNVSVTLQDDTGRTPLDICNEKGHKECAEFLKEWQKQSQSEHEDAHLRQSLKKVRFDENGEKSKVIPVDNNDKSLDISKDDYLIIAGELSKECLEEKLKMKKEEWMKSSFAQDNEKQGDSSQAQIKAREETGGFKGGRRVGKRSSFKDKNAKYQKDKNNNRGGWSMIMGKLQTRKPRGEYYGSSPLIKTGDRSSHPDLIQSVMQADKNASVGFRRRPSLEFFQDLLTQVDANSGKQNNNQSQSTRGHVATGEPMTIYQNGTLRSSRNNLTDFGHPVDVRTKANDKQDNQGRTQTIEKAVEGKKNELEEKFIDISSQETDEGISRPDDGISRPDDSISRPVIKQRKNETRDKSNTKPHPQKEIKLPKGFMGILPKSISNPNMNVEPKVERSKNSANKKTAKSSSYEKENVWKEVNPGMNEHYLIHSLPLPTHRSHRGAAQDKVSFYSYNLTNERKQTQTKWMSVRESFGSFFASLRGKKREKMYEVTDMLGSDGSYQRKQESKRFNITKSFPIKKRKSISLEHMPNFSSTGEEIRVNNSTKSGKSTIKRLSYLQPGYTEPDIYRLTSMALDDTLKGKVNSPPQEVRRKQAPKPEESLDYIVANKDVTGFQLDSLQVNNEDQKETGNALMW